MELVILLLKQLDVVISLKVVKRRWNCHHGDHVPPGQFKPALDDQENAGSREIEEGRGRPQELVIEDFKDLRTRLIVNLDLEVLQLRFLLEYEL